MYCQCNANASLTCFRSVTPISPYRLCISDGNRSVCSTNETPPSQFKQFCFNCETTKAQFRTACNFCRDNYRGKSYYSGQRWNPNRCTLCLCINGKTKCIYFYKWVEYLPRFRPRCMNCNIKTFVRRYPCKPCKNYVTGRRYQSGSTWWINRCFICLCFVGRTYCRREGRIVKNGVQTSYPLCARCNTYKLINYMRINQCKICKDDYHRLIRLHKETFLITYNVKCRCNDGIIQCNRTVSEAARGMFYIPSVACYNCSSIDIKNLKEAKGTMHI